MQPERGLDVMPRRQGTDRHAALANGPGNLCRAFAIDLALNGWDVTRGTRLWVAMPPVAPALQIVHSRRIGVRMTSNCVPLLPSVSLVARCANGAHSVKQGQQAALGTGSVARAPEPTNPALTSLVCPAVPWSRLPCVDPTTPVCRCCLRRGPYERLLRDGTRAIRSRCTSVDTSMQSAYW